MKKAGLLISVFFLLTLTGCSMTGMQEAFEKKMEEYVLQNSGITDDSSYEQYMKLKEEGKLNEQGLYNEMGEDIVDEILSDDYSYDEEIETKQVRVTFAQNSYLTVRYYYDKGLEQPIESDYCYLNPGESIYASQPECKNANTNAYQFLEYRICEYDSDGNRGNILSASSESKVLTIPEDFTGTELSVEPTGTYQKREVSFEAYVIDEAGGHRAVAGGKWKINDDEYTDDKAEISPSNEYIVRYVYNPEEYYISDTQPKYYSDNNGIVEFPKVTSIDKNAFYSVQLHSFITVSLEGNHDNMKIEINDKKENKKKEVSLEKDAKVKKLKAGDKIIIETTDGYRVFCSQVDFGRPENLGDGVYRYSFDVPDINEEIRIKISKSALMIDVANNVGNQISFDIETFGVSKSDCAYEKQRFNGDCTIFEDTIGAEEFIEISAKNGTLPPNCALRFDITKEDSNSNKTKEISYLSTLPASKKIMIYENASILNLSQIYKRIDIRISLVEIAVFKQEEIENGSIEVKFTDTNLNTEIHDGDILELSREVEVVISVNQGYYISGKKVSDNTYRDTMKFEKCNMTEIIESHPIKKLIQITLNPADDYGTCVFKIDGKETSGEAELKEGQKITLEYVITDTGYQIVRESEDFIGKIFGKDKKSATIEITAAMDGMVITRDNFEIKVEKSEGRYEPKGD